MKFEKTIDVKWADCDPNKHVRHSTYYDYGGHARIAFFHAAGFSVKELDELKIGPILFKEECSFIQEIKPEDTITVNVLKGNMLEDGSRWVLHHEIFNASGKKCAHITTKGAWLDLTKRKLTIPPAALAEAMHSLEKGEEYVYRKES